MSKEPVENRVCIGLQCFGPPNGSATVLEQLGRLYWMELQSWEVDLVAIS